MIANEQLGIKKPAIESGFLLILNKVINVIYNFDRLTPSIENLTIRWLALIQLRHKKGG